MRWVIAVRRRNRLATQRLSRLEFDRRFHNQNDERRWIVRFSGMVGAPDHARRSDPPKRLGW